MFLNYIKLTLKILIRNKFYTVITLFGISLTLSILMLIYSVIDNTVGARAPEVNQDKTLEVSKIYLRGEGRRSIASLSNYFLERYVKTLKQPSLISIFSQPFPSQLFTENKKVERSLKYTDSEYWQILGFNFLEGKAFDKEMVSTQSLVAVISEETRELLFGDQSAVGKYVNFKNKNYKIIGVVENIPLLRFKSYSDIWIPISADVSRNEENKYYGKFKAMLYAETDEQYESMKEEFKKQMATVELFYPDQFTEVNVYLDSSLEAFSRQIFKSDDSSNSNKFILIISIFMILFMFLPALNLVNMNLNRMMERLSEIGIRKSFGATSFNLVKQFMIENIVMTFLGGIIAFILAFIFIELINSSGIFNNGELIMSYRVFGFSILICLLFGAISGIVPAYRMSRLNPIDSLRGAEHA